MSRVRLAFYRWVASTAFSVLVGIAVCSLFVGWYAKRVAVRESREQLKAAVEDSVKRNHDDRVEQNEIMLRYLTEKLDNLAREVAPPRHDSAFDAALRR